MSALPGTSSIESDLMDDAIHELNDRVGEHDDGEMSSLPDAWLREAATAITEGHRRRVVELEHALRLIAQHARLDERERGFGEASRYYVIAEGALNVAPH